MDKKSIWEIIFTPLVVAIVGVAGTLLVTNSQIESSNTLAQVQQKIKIIEIFSDKITKKDEAERTLAIKVLAAVDPDLGKKITSAIADTNLDVTREIDGIPTSLAMEVKAEIRTEETQPDIANRKYLVGYYAYDISDNEFNKVLKVLTDSSYTIVTESLLSLKPSWMAGSATVLYYSVQSKSDAEDLAKLLTETTGSRFKIQKGAGLGVPKGQESKRLFVHYLK